MPENSSSPFASLANYGTPPTDPLTSKKATVSEASQMKAFAFGGEELHRLAAIATENENDLAQAQAIKDANTLTPAQLAYKYGVDVAQALSGYDRASDDYYRYTNRERSGADTAKDLALDTGAAAVNFAGGLATLGSVVVTDPISRATGLPSLSGLTSDLTGRAVGAIKEQKSDLARGRQEIFETKQALDSEDNRNARERARASGEGDTVSWLKEQGRGFLDTLGNYAEDPLVASGIVPEAIASVAGISGLIKTAGKTLALKQIAKQGKKVDDLLPGEWQGILAAAEKKVAPAMIAISESGSSVSQAQQEILSMTEEELMEGSPRYKEMRSKGATDDEARNQLVMDTGLTTAAVALPLTAIAGKLSDGFAAHPLTNRAAAGTGLTGKVKSAGVDIVKEGFEETLQGIGSEVAVDIGLNTQAGADLGGEIGANIGSAAATNLLAGTVAAGGFQAPSVATETAKATGRTLAKGVGAAVDGRKAAIETKLDAQSAVGSAAQAKSVDTLQTATEVLVPEPTPAAPQAVEAQPGTAEEAVKKDPKTRVTETAVKALFLDQDQEAAFGGFYAEELSDVQAKTPEKQALQTAAVLTALTPTVKNDKDTFKQAVAAFDVLDLSDQLGRIDSDEMFAAEAELDPADGMTAALNVARDELNTIRSSGALEKAAEVVSKMTREQFESVVDISPLTSGDFTSPAAKTALRALDIAARHNPSMVNSEMAGVVFNNLSASKKADPKQLKSVKSLEEISRLIEQNAAAKEKFAKEQTTAIQQLPQERQAAEAKARLKTQDMVKSEVTGDGEMTNARGKKMSVLDHISRINSAMHSGQVESAGEYMRELGNFARSMQNKVVAMNKSMDTEASIKHPYQSYQNGAFSERTGLNIRLDSPNSVALAHGVYADAELVIGTYNSLAERYGAAILKDKAKAAKARLQVPPVHSKLGSSEAQEVVKEAAQPKETVPEKKTETVKEKAATKVVEEKAVDPQQDTQPVESQDPVAEEAAGDGIDSDTIEETAVPEGADNQAPRQRIEKLLSLMGGVKRGINRLFDAYRVKDDPSLLLTHESPAQHLLENLSKLEGIAVNTLTGVSAPQQQMLKKVLKTVLPDLTARMNDHLQKALSNQTTNRSSEKKKNGSLLEQLQDPTITNIMSWRNTRSLNFLKKTDKGEIAYDPAIVEAAVMAGLQWLITKSASGSPYIDKEDIAKIFDVRENQVTREMINAVLSGPRHHRMLNDVARDFENLLGVSRRKDATVSYTQGLSKAMALNVMEVFQQAGLLKVTYSNQKVVSKSSAKTDADPENHTYIGVRPISLKDAPEAGEGRQRAEERAEWIETLAPVSDIFSQVFVPKLEKERYFEEAPQNTRRHILGNPAQSMSKAEMKAVKDRESRPYFINAPLHAMVKALGEENLLKLRGYKDYDPETTNKEHASSIEGKNQSLRSAITGVNAYIEGAKAHVKEDGPFSVDQVKIFFGWMISSVGRMQQQGPITPQGDKYAREMMTITNAELDMTSERDLDLFWLSVAQSMGIKVEQRYFEHAIKEAKAMMGQVDGLVGPVKNDYSPALEALSEYLSRQKEDPETVMTPEETAAFMDNVSSLTKGEATMKQIHALLAVARLNQAQIEGDASFKTSLSFEADGKTDGPINAIMHLATGPFGAQWVKTMAKGGMFFGAEPMTLNEHILQRDQYDLYTETTVQVEAALAKHLDTLPAAGQEHALLLLDVMNAFLPGLTFDRGDGNKLAIGRDVVKNPLTVFLYGSSQNGVAGKITSALVDEFYRTLTEISEQYASGGINKISDHKVFAKDKELHKKLVTLLNSEVFPKGGVAPKGDTTGQQLFGKPTETKLTRQQLENLESAVNHLFTAPLFKAIDATTGGLKQNMELMQKASQVQAIIFKDLFEQRVTAEQAKQVAEGKLVKGQLLSENDYARIFGELSRLAPTYKTDQQEFNISGGEQQQSDMIVAQTFKSKLASGAVVIGPSAPSVKVSPFMVMGTGDGRMVLNIYQNGDIEVQDSLPVFDGVELKATDIVDGSRKINKAVFDAWMQSNIFESLADTFDAFLLEVPEGDALDSMILRVSKEMERPLKLRKDQGFTLGDITAVRNQLRSRARDIKARKEAIAQMSTYTDHMAGGMSPHHNDGVAVDPALVVEKLNEFYYESLARQKKEAKARVARPAQEGNKKAIKEGVEDLGTALPDNTVTELTGDQAAKLLTSHNGLTKEQSDTVRAVVKHFGNGPLKDMKFFFGNQKELTRVRRELYGDKIKGSLGRGLYSPDHNVAFISSRSSETILHEILHVYTAGALRSYYANPQAADSHTRLAVPRIEKLMEEFRNMSFGENRVAPNAMKSAVHLQSELDRLEGEPFQQVSEFLSYMLSNQHLLEIGEKTKTRNPLYRLAHRTIKMLKELLGIRNMPGTTMLSNLRFNTQVLISQADQTTRESFAGVTLNQLNPGSQASDARMSSIGQRYLDRLAAGLEATVKDRPELAKKKREMRNRGHEAVQRAIAQGYDFSTAQAQTYAAIHAVLSSGLQMNSAAMNRLNKLYGHALKHLRSDDFLEDPNNRSQQALDEALMRYNYVLGIGGLQKSAAGRTDMLASFLALAQVDDQLRDLLTNLPAPSEAEFGEKSVDGILTSSAEALVNGLTHYSITRKNLGHDVTSQLDILADVMSEIQGENRLLQTMANWRVADKMNDFVADHIHKGSAKAVDYLADRRKNAANKYTLGVYAGLEMLASLGNKKDSDRTGDALTSLTNNMSYKWDSIRSLLTDVRGMTTDNAALMRLLNPVKAVIDAMRQDSREKIPAILAKKFNRPLTKGERSHMFTGIGKADLLALGQADAIALLEDPTVVDAKIRQEEAVLKNHAKTHASYRPRAEALAKFMVTGIPTEGMVKNAYAIAGRFGLQKTPFDAPKDLVASIDRLTSLYAFKLLDPETKSSLSNLAQTQKDGIAAVTGFHEAVRALELNKLGEDPTEALINGYKGYVPSTSREGASVIVADDADFEKLARRGYTRLSDYKGDNAETYRGKRGYYTSTVGGQSAFRQGIAQTVHETYMGVDIRTGQSRTGATTGYITGAEKTRIEKRLQGRRSAAGVTEHLLPIYNVDGSVRAYERSLAPDQLVALHRDTDLTRMLGVWSGRILEETKAHEFNMELMKVLADTWKNRKPSETSEFVNAADKDIDDPIVKDAWDTLGWRFKQDAAEVFGKEDFFPVRRSELNDALGYRAAGLTDPFTGITRLSPTTQKMMQETFSFIMGPSAFKYLRKSEDFVTDAVSYAKTTIVVRSFEIGEQNLISNMTAMLMHGVGFVAALKGMRDKFVEITGYVANEEERQRLEVEIAIDRTNVAKVKRINARLKAIEEANEKLSIWPLIQAGEFSTISESLTEADLAIREGKLSEFMEKAVEKLPGWGVTVAKNILVTKDTALFKGLNRMVQYGDFVAKAVLYDHMIKVQGKPEREVLDTLFDEFVPYNRLPGRGRDYLESIGLLWFYNYKLRISKIALKFLRDKPVTTLLYSGGLAPVLDIDTPISSNIVGVVADGTVGYSVGPQMGLHSGSLNPWVNLTN